MCTAKRLLASLVLPSVPCLTIALGLSFPFWDIGMHVYAYTYFAHTRVQKYNDYYVACICIYDSVPQSDTSTEQGACPAGLGAMNTVHA